MRIYPFLALLVVCGCSGQKAPATNSAQGPKAVADSEVQTPGSPSVNPDPEAAPPSSAPPSQASNANTQTPATSDPEAVSPPAQITGALLHCGILLEASDALPTAQIGCRLDDKDGNRIDSLKLGAKAEYSATAVPVGIKVTQRDPTLAIRDYDSIFDIAGANKGQVQDALNKTQFRVELKGVIRGEALGTIVASLNPTDSEIKRGDWLSFLSNASPTYIDLSTSLVWALDNGTGYTLAEGNTHCNDLIYAGSSSWRLPTITELQTAKLDGLGVAFADGGNMNIDSQRFGGYASSTLEFPDQPSVIGVSKFWTINLAVNANPTVTLNPVENRFSVICVHE